MRVAETIIHTVTISKWGWGVVGGGGGGGGGGAANFQTRVMGICAL